MAVTNFQSELWSAMLQVQYRKSLVWASPAVVNRNYEGMIQNQGDTVHIISIGDPSISSHTANDAITYEALTDADRALLINQAKRFSFAVDDVNKAQAAGDMIGEATRRAAYKLADTADQYVASLYSGVDSANAIGTVSITSAALAVSNLILLGQKLDEANVPTEGRYVVVTPWYHSLLLGSDLFARYDASGSTDGLRNGLVGRAFGMDVYKSNNCVNVTGDDWLIQAGHPDAITFADQINSVEALRLESKYGDGVRGLNLYGAKLVRPTGIATLTASIT